MKAKKEFGLWTLRPNWSVGALISLSMLVLFALTGNVLADYAPINGLWNGDFEDATDPFGTPWQVGGSTPMLEHVGLSATGLAPGTKAAYLTETVQGLISQEIVTTSSTWELGFLFAAEQPESSRTLQFTVNHTDNANTNMILMRIDPSGNLQAYNPHIPNWDTLPGCSGIIDFSIDADEDGSLDDAGDTLNVYSLKIVGDYSETPSYDFYLSNANTGTLTLLGDDLDWFIGTAPSAGDTITRLQFCQYQTEGEGSSYMVDEVYFQSGAVPEPSSVALILSMFAASLFFVTRRR